MKNKINRALILFYLFIILISSSLNYSFNYDKSIFKNIYFEVIDSKNGLSNSSISCIVQDSKGFIWFSTQNGLNRYDGKQFLIFNKHPFVKNAIPNQLIQTMYMDKDDILWLGTYGGLCKFDINRGTFTSYRHDINDDSSLPNDTVIAIERDKEGKLWVGTLKGLAIFDEKNEKFNRIIYNDKKEGPTKESTIRDIFTDNLGNVWIGTYDGIYKYYDGKYVLYSSEKQYQDNKKESNSNVIKPFESNYPAANSAMVITQDNEKNLWFGVWGFGLVKYDANKNLFINYPLPVYKIYSLLFVDDDNLLVGTWGEGLYNFNKKDNTFDVVENKKMGLTIPNNTIYSLFKDRSGIVWIGTHGAGVLKWVINKPDLVYLKYEEKNPNSIPNNKIKAIFEDKYGFIWIGSYNGGLVRYDPAKQEIVKYISSGKEDGTLSDNIVRCIFQDSNGNLWIATNKYLNLYDYKTGKFKYFKKADFGIDTPNEQTFTYVTEDKKKNLLIGTYLSGIIIAPLSNDKSKILDFSNIKFISTQTNPSISNDLVFDILIDHNENIWIGTNKGLNLLNTRNWEVKKFYYNVDNPQGISDDVITDIFEDSNKRIWVCTSNGLNLYDSVSEKFTHIILENGYKDNYINSIQELDDGIIVFTTFGNLIKFNPNTSEKIVFDYDDGLLTKEFSTGITKLKDGSVLLGGIGIVNIIKSQLLVAEDYNPEIQIVSITIEGKEYKENEIYYEDVNFIKTPYNLNSISIRFVSLDYSAPNTILYSYKIDKLNKDWQYIGNEGVINLVNLKPGNYKIFLRGTNSGGFYSQNIKTIKIKVNPPFYMSWWAILIYIIIIFGIGFLITLFLKERAFSQILLERKRLIEERDAFLEEEIIKQKEIEKNLIESKESLESLNNAKDTFIAQISHEFKNPLSLLLGYIQILEKKEDDAFKKKAISNMYSIAQHILDLITKILDMAKISLGKINVDLEEVDFISFLNTLAESHKIIAEQKGLKFEFFSDKNLPSKILLDSVKVRQILNNLISNAIKYTEKGFVKFNVSFQKNNDNKIDLIFEIIDSGVGLTEKEKEKIFESFYRGVDSLEVEGTGLGLSISQKLAELLNGQILVESEKGVGSKFTLILKEVSVLE